MSLLLFCILGTSMLLATLQENPKTLTMDNVKIDINNYSDNSNDDYTSESDDNNSDDDSAIFDISDLSDSNDDDYISDSDDNNSDENGNVTFTITSWNNASAFDRMILMQLRTTGFINDTMLPWISGRLLAIKIDVNTAEVTNIQVL
ncbi:hypothetical protein X798_06948 [Onchocerca flexuosa]|uniref:Uncharacterized protein n=1 Tax=Onchocerca flexuosa TaxID=387005 RepID=A0A238BKW2_9BILA|nr:hypothetical protein X798_06948 [Onchocerca flexuosa]